jgi:hypothetical protein
MVGFVTEQPGLDSDFCFGARIRSKGNTGFWGGKKKKEKKKRERIFCLKFSFAGGKKNLLNEFRLKM